MNPLLETFQLLIELGGKFAWKTSVLRMVNIQWMYLPGHWKEDGPWRKIGPLSNPPWLLPYSHATSLPFWIASSQTSCITFSWRNTSQGLLLPIAYAQCVYLGLTLFINWLKWKYYFKGETWDNDEQAYCSTKNRRELSKTVNCRLSVDTQIFPEKFPGKIPNFLPKLCCFWFYC